MHLRSTVVIGLTGAAAVAAVIRFHGAASSPAPSTLTFQSPAPARPRSGRHVRPGADPGARIVVYVAGAVRRPGLYTLASPARAADALGAAGGSLADADLVAVNLAQPLTDGDEVAVPRLDGDAPNASPRKHRRGHRTAHRTPRRHRRSDVPPSAPVDLNSADASQLETLPGIGPRLAERIVAFREASGAFASTDDLLDVAGVTAAELAKIEPYVTATASGPP